MERTIVIKHLHSEDPRLKRQVNHDSKSKDFAFDTTGLQIIDVTHAMHIPILDQGQVGSCTGNAGIGALATDPFPQAANGVYSLDEAGALKLYSDAETIDGDGPYPPNDHGSSGLSIAKALKNAGLISGYQHTFTLNDALKALTVYPIITGTNWYDGMYNPDPDGRVHPTGKVVGGHEYKGFKIDVANSRIWFCNSWGDSWGVKGTFYMTWEDYATLLAQSGDVTVLIPATIVPPTPATFFFEKQLQLGMTNADVTQLQKRLSTEYAADGLPCYRYPTPTAQVFTKYFGENTKEAVGRYQVVNKIANPGDTGYGRVGPATLAKLNLLKKKS